MLKLNYKSTNLYKLALDLEEKSVYLLPGYDKIGREFHIHAAVVKAAMNLKSNIAKSLYHSDIEAKQKYTDAALNSILDLDTAAELCTSWHSSISDPPALKFSASLDACYAELMKQVVELKNK